MKQTVDLKELEKIKKQAKELVARSAERDTMFNEITDMYWMEDSSAGLGGRANEDIKMTISPSARNEVIGMVRLLTTTAPRFKATSEDGDPDNVEKALDMIIKRSNEVQQAKVEVEASRCAVLYGEVHLMIESIDDILAIPGIPEYEKARLREMRLRTPFLTTALSPREAYPAFGKTGMRSYLHRYKTWGADLKDRWGVLDLKDDLEYTVNDWYGMEYRAVWLDEVPKELAFAKHGMARIPIVVKFSDGTSLFGEEDKKRQPFLYAKWKGGWWKRENLLYTTLFTSMFERGTGPLAAIDPESIPDGVLEVNYAGAFRWIKARAQLLNDKAFDNDLLNAKGLLDQVGGESTIYKQTLGDNIGAGQAAFSTISLLSQSGRLPLTSPQEAIADAFRDAGYIMLRWIKAENIQNPWVKAGEIDDDVEVDCLMEVNLPQDMFRNAQIGAQLKGTVSEEWIHSNLLQIPDSEAMKKKVWSEMAADAIFQTRMEQFIKQLTAPAPTPAPTTGQVDPRMMGNPAPGGQVDPRMAQILEERGAGVPGMMGGPNAAMAGGGQMPLTEPVERGQ